jgi:hypothetical protein
MKFGIYVLNRCHLHGKGIAGLDTKLAPKGGDEAVGQEELAGDLS